MAKRDAAAPRISPVTLPEPTEGSVDDLAAGARVDGLRIRDGPEGIRGGGGRGAP